MIIEKRSFEERSFKLPPKSGKLFKGSSIVLNNKFK
jgi:hypothetical protein